MVSDTNDDFIFSYGITSLPATCHSGWCLRLYEHRATVAEQHFPIAPDSLAQSLDWWQTLTELERAEYMAGFTGIPDAYRAYRLGVAYAEAETAARMWLDARVAS